MKISVTAELYIFLCMCINGLIHGLLFDFFRIFRKFAGRSFLAVSLSDIIYWILTAVLFTVSVLHFNDGELRWYILAGIILGLIFYFLLLSRLIITIFFQIIKLFLQIFKLILKILLTPALFLYKILLESFFKWVRKIYLKVKKKTGLKIRIRKLRNKNDKKEK